ncbi:hypothetical protein [Desulfatibacillum aliphaticivorans]|uniref:hypothetical protein n=1 Tax=Desulfatibacillum aliphaticivorans TaxID=218208 RepID=UPI0003F7665F|nr:hypothetical protein [Desulfatibacillum aliphaticivorans]
MLCKTHNAFTTPIFPALAQEGKKHYYSLVMQGPWRLKKRAQGPFAPLPIGGAESLKSFILWDEEDKILVAVTCCHTI